MDLSLDELKTLTSACRKAAEAHRSGGLASACQSLRQAIESIHEAWSGSFIGYQACIYLDGFTPRAAGEKYDIEWGSIGDRLNKTRGEWRQYSKREVEEELLSRSHAIDLAMIEQMANSALETFERCKEELLPILDACMGTDDSSVLAEIREEVTALEGLIPRSQFREEMMSSATRWSRDSTAIAQGMQMPPHLERLAWLLEQESCFQQCGKLAGMSNRTMKYLKRRDLLRVGIKQRRASANEVSEKTQLSQELRDGSSQMHTSWRLVIVGGLLAFVVGVLGNLVAAWLQQEVLRNAFTLPRVALIVALTIAGLLAMAWLDKTRQEGARQTFSKKVSKQPGPIHEQRFVQPEPPIQPGSILIVTATKTEAQAVLETFSQSAGKRWTRQTIGNKTYYDLDVHGGAPVYMVQSEPGTAVPGGALVTVRQAIQDLSPQAVVMCGFAFGLRPDKQQLGDILVAKQLLAYEPQKVDLKRGQIPRGDRTTSAERLLDRFRSGDNDWQGAPTHFGLVVSGEKLVNDPAFRDWLLKTEPEAIGGEMEGAGLYVAARDAKVDWILVKAICDWGDGDKNDEAQPRAARNAAQFVLHVLQLGGWDEPEGSSQQVASSDAIQQDVSIFSEQTGNVTVIGKIVAVSQAIDERIFKRLKVEQRVGFILLILLIILFGVSGSFILYSAVYPPLSKCTGEDFCIAVAGFTELGKSGESEIGRGIAENLFQRLATGLDEIGVGDEVTILRPDQVGEIIGQTEEVRAEAAEEAAAKANADVIVYGWADTSSRVWQIGPEFFIGTSNSYEAGDLAGQYSIGTPISVIGGNEWATRDYASEELLARTHAIANITAGLTYYNAGYLDPEHFNRALTYFRKAEEISGWDEQEGKQVLYVLIGNAAGKSSDFEMAEAYHQKAIELNSEYARAHVGLAGVYYMLALGGAEASGNPRDTDLDLIDQAIKEYELAAEATNPPPLADILTKVHFGLGQCYFALGLARMYSGDAYTEDMARATSEFLAVIADYGDGANPRVRIQAAEAHRGLALIYRFSAQYNRAAQEYQVAASLWWDNPSKRKSYEECAQEMQTLVPVEVGTATP